MGSGGFSFLESTTAFLGGSEATYSLPGTKTNNNLVGCLKKVLISSIIQVLEQNKYKKISKQASPTQELPGKL